MAGPPQVRTLDAACDILECIADAESEGVTMAGVVTALALPKTTVFRILSALEKRGYVERFSGASRYRLGIRLMELGLRMLDTLDLRDVARPELERLVGETNEIAHLAVLDQFEVVYIDKVEGNQAIRIYSRIGKRAPAYCTGVGKALLSGVSPDELRRYLDSHPLKQFTPATITDPEQLRKELTRVQRLGYAIDNQEHELGVRCIAVPIYNHTGKVVAALSLTAPTSRTDEEQWLALVPDIMQAGLRVSRRLGWRHHLSNQTSRTRQEGATEQ